MKTTTARPTHCENCGSKSGIVGHHEDYAMPDVLTFLCRSCHGKLHGYRKRIGMPIGPRPKGIRSVGLEIVSTALPPDVLERIQEAAKAEERSVSQWLRMLILKALEKK